MKKIVKLTMIAMVASLAVGCATNDDIANLQSQIDGLKSSVAQASSDAASAKSAADSASAQAASAEAAANRAAQIAQETNEKLDKLFKHKMKK
jgi:outer membrane murein-binding lipoprotein Lpp